MESISHEAGSSPDLKRTRRQRAAHSSQDITRLPPHNIECEMASLGCVLISPNDCLNECIIKFGSAKHEVYYDLRHQEIFTAMLEMYENREQIDLITLQQHLKNKNLLEQVGGIAYLAGLPDTVPSAANLSYYNDHIFEKYELRKLIHTCTDVVARAYEFEGEAEKLFDECERDILSIRQRNVSHIKTGKELVHASIQQIEEMHKKQGRTGGIPTGFPDLDKLTDGLHPGDMIVISGFEKSGKTSLAMNIAENVIIDSKLPVGVFSLEMTAESLMTRMLCSKARVNLRDVRDGFMSERDFPKLTSAAGKLSNACIYVDDSSDLSITQLRANARRMVQLYGIKLAVVDYIQLLSSPSSNKQQSREQEISSVSKGIKGMAKELGIPVIALSQQNDDGKLRESRAVQQDLDGWWKLIFDDEEDEEDAPARKARLRIERQRNGPTGNVFLTFLKSYTRFESACPISDEDVPN